MGMRGHLRQVSSELVAQMRKQPELVRQVIDAAPSGLDEFATQFGIDSSNPDAMVEHLRAFVPAGQEAHLELLKEHLANIQTTKGDIQRDLAGDFEGKTLDLDKSWHMIHFLLTGSDAPVGTVLDNVLMGGEPIGNMDDFDLGAPRYLSPQEVRELAKILSNFDANYVERRFRELAGKGENVYSFRGDEDDLEYAQHYFE